MYVYIYIQLNHSVVQQKLIQHSKSIILQLKKKDLVKTSPIKPE